MSIVLKPAATSDNRVFPLTPKTGYPSGHWLWHDFCSRD